jgi:WD40 repeat protein
VSPQVLLSLFCAAAFSPLIAAEAGISATAAVAGVGVLSSIGGGVLGEIINSKMDRLRRAGGEQSAPADVEREVAGDIQRVLAAGDVSAQVLSAEIAAALRKIDAGGTALREAVKTGNEQVRHNLVAAIGRLSTAFDDMQFLLSDIAVAAAEIQVAQDSQAAQLRVIIDRVGWAATEARLTREEAATWRRGSGDAGSAGPRWIRGCPYRGLRPFDESDAEVFYGRERVIAELIGKVAGQMSEKGILVVTGASGAGKSSLLRAGLIPALARGLQLEGSQFWPRVVITPTRNPVSELATHLAALSGLDAVAIRDALARRPGDAHMTVRQAIMAATARNMPPGLMSAQRLLLVIDQFEQVFTVTLEEAQAFITALCAAASSPVGSDQHPPALVVIAVRGDFLDRCAAHPELAGSLGNRQFIVGPMTETELRLAITAPAEAAGLQIDPSLTGTILSDLRVAGDGNAAGVLPLLSQAMLLTWNNREGVRLTSRGYGQSGGVSHAVQVSADGVYDSLPTRQQELAKHMFRFMVATSRDGRPTRRPLTRDSWHVENPWSDPRDVDAVLEAFADQRLILLDRGTAQIAHDALLSAWPRLRSWLEEDQANWALYAQLSDDVAAWDGNGRDPSFLYRGTQLAAFRQAAARWETSAERYPSVTATQRTFLDISERGAARGRRQRQVLAGTLVVLLIASVVGAFVATAAAKSANRQRDLANQQRNLAVSGQLAVRSEALDAADPVTASLLAAAAAHFDLTPQVRDSLLDVAAQPERAVLTAGSGLESVQAFSPDGRMLATASGGDIVLWDVVTHHRIGRSLPDGSSIEMLAFGAGGGLLTSFDEHGTARIWNVASHREIGLPLKTAGKIAALGFAHGKAILAGVTGPDLDTVQFWDLTAHRQTGTPVSTHGNSILSLTLSPDGTLLAAATQAGGQVWEVASGTQLPSPARAGPAEVDHVAFSPDGKILATVNGAGAVLSQTATGQQIGSVMRFQGGMFPVVAFGPDGTMLATAGITGGAILWDLADHKQAGVFQTGASQVDSLAFSPDGKTLATVDQAGQAQLWDTATWHQTGKPIVIGNDTSIAVNTEAISPDSKILAISEDSGVVELRDTATQRQLAVLTPAATGNSGLGGAITFSPDGKMLAVGNTNGTVQLWSVATRQPAGPSLHFRGTTGTGPLAFSPTGRILAGVTSGGVQLVNIDTGQQIGPTMSVKNNNHDGIGTIAFSPDGKTLATTTTYKAQLWDTATQRELDTFQIGHPFVVGNGYEQLGAVAFSPNGKILAAATAGTIQLWDMTSRRRLGAPLNLGTQAGYTAALAFSPSGNFLAVAINESTSLFDVNTHERIGTSLTPAPIINNEVSRLIISPSGRTLAAAGMKAAWLWDITLPADPIAAACSIAGRSLTRSEWNSYISSEPYQKVCG